MEEKKALDIDLSRENIRVLHQALHEVLDGSQAIDDWEFDTRMRVTPEKSRALMRRISDAC